MEDVRDQGKYGERQVKDKWRMRGYEVKRTGRGHDYYVTKRDPYTKRVIDSKYIEVKTGEYAKLSRLQQKKRKKYGSRYVVERVEPHPIYNAIKNSDVFGTSGGSKNKRRKSSNSNFASLFGPSTSKGKGSRSCRDYSGLIGSSSRSSKGSSSTGRYAGLI